MLLFLLNFELFSGSDTAKRTARFENLVCWCSHLRSYKEIWRLFLTEIATTRLLINE
jgi:hypothetical protein